MAAELALSGDVVDAERALEVGLVNRVVDHDALIDEAVALATKIAARPRLALEATKQALRTSWHTDLAGSMASGFWAVATMHHTADLREGVAAAREKRAPRYNAS
jgi:enoyl-CoA hydratase